jgi:hypothetical protein
VVAQSAGGKLSRFGTDGSGGTTLFQTRPSVEVGAVEAAGPGTLFALTGKTKAGKKFAKLVHLAKDGTLTTWANMRALEKNRNPDHGVTYGFRQLGSSCASKLPKELGPASYRGIVDSHPYATTRMPDGSAMVAEAAGNDIIHVTPGGHRSVVAVLPAQPLHVTKKIARGLHLPACAAGHTYWFEPVPTDVEYHGGLLYVTTLPGGPEDPSLGARGSVYTVDPASGAWHRIGRGFAGATDLAVSPKGKVYVTELFANAISTIKNGMAKKVFSVPAPSAVEWHNGHLFATTNTFTNGSIVKLTP